MNKIHSFLSVGFLVVLCCLPAVPAVGAPAGETNSPPVEAAETHSLRSTSLNTYVPDDVYKLRVGDKLSFQILEDRDTAQPLTVADSGELDVPYIGRVKAANLTCMQLAQACKVGLEKEYYYRATVIIAVDVENKQMGQVYVWGNVRNQGPLDMTAGESLTAGKAIVRAGGFGDFANKKKVKVIQNAQGADGKTQILILNMADILEDGRTDGDVLLKPGDSVIVPSRMFNY